MTVESIVDETRHMGTIQVVVDEPLLKEADRVARRLKVNRSALIRDALREHLRRLRTRQREDADRRGFETHSDAGDDLAGWERVAAWPEQ